MSLGDSWRSISVLLSLGQLVVGCSSWDEDTPDHLDFALPTVAWVVSADHPQWRRSPGSDVATPAFVCSGPQALATDCCAPPFDCQKYPFACDPNSNFCALTFDVEVAQLVDLVAQVPAVAAVRGRVFAKVELLSLSTKVTKPDGFPVRSAALFIGPEDLATSSNASAALLIPVPLVSGRQAAAPDASALQAFSRFGSDYENPFSLLLSLHVVVPNKTTPAGDFSLTLDGQARAYY
jgi:hypothetical protein